MIQQGIRAKRNRLDRTYTWDSSGGENQHCDLLGRDAGDAELPLIELRMLPLDSKPFWVRIAVDTVVLG